MHFYSCCSRTYTRIYDCAFISMRNVLIFVCHTQRSVSLFLPFIRGANQYWKRKWCWHPTDEHWKVLKIRYCSVTVTLICIFSTDSPLAFISYIWFFLLIFVQIWHINEFLLFLSFVNRRIYWLFFWCFFSYFLGFHLMSFSEHRHSIEIDFVSFILFRFSKSFFFTAAFNFIENTHLHIWFKPINAPQTKNFNAQHLNQ